MSATTEALPLGPSILLVDDSDTILAYERSVLGAHYALTSAKNGRAALEQMRVHTPELVLLDLSMPEMDGEEVLREMQADAQLRAIPVVIVSSERSRGEACVARGALAYLPKPLRAPDLLGAVERAFAELARRRAQGSVCVIVVDAGGVRVALRLDDVRLVLMQVATRREGAARTFELAGEPVVVVDLPRRLGARHRADVVERKIVVVESRPLVGLTVDAVDNPDVVPASDLVETTFEEARSQAVRRDGVTIPIIEATRLFAQELGTHAPAAR